MTLRDQISITWNYGKGLFLIGGVYNVMCTMLLARSFSYAGFVDAFILKVLVTVVSLYLIKQFKARDSIFFFINLGLSRRKLLIRVLTTDFIILAVLLTIVLLLNG
jgi:hypothetical protein